MFTESTRKKIENLYLENVDAKIQALIPEEMEMLSSNEKLLMKLLYATLPMQDLGGTSYEVLLSYVRHAVFLYEHVPFVSELQEDIFLHDIFYPRVGTEKLVDCRGFFYETICRDLNLSLSEIDVNEKELVLSVNAWCMGEMTYHAADLRTQNPLVSYQFSDGRCGEESVFAVSVLRSIGIPARQVYVPFWSHCDDNHAWVEVFVEGRWQFLGACEYEPVLNKGWFNLASSRAMLVHSRTFFEREDGAFLHKKGAAYYYNETKRYAKTEKIAIRCVASGIKTEEKVKISFYIPNESCLSKLTEIHENTSGYAEIALGLGTVLVIAEMNGKNVKFILDVHENNPEILIDFSDLSVKNIKEAGVKLVETQVEYTSFAPNVNTSFRFSLSESEEKLKEQVVTQANAYRMQKVLNGPKIQPELLSFVEKEDADTKLLLSLVSEKDYRDFPLNVFMECLSELQILKGKYDEKTCLNEMYEGVLSPRIGDEELTPFRKLVCAAFSEEELQSFAADPSMCFDVLQKRYQKKTDRYYEELFMTPEAVLKLCEGDDYGRALLFVSVMRTIHVPAFFDAEKGQVTVLLNHKLVVMKGEDERKILFQNASGENQSITKILRCNFDGFKSVHTLNAKEEALILSDGSYALLSAVRLPSGNQKIHLQFFDVTKECKNIIYQSPSYDAKELLSSYEIPDVVTKKLNEKALFFLLEPYEEPTEHILNELLKEKELLSKDLEIHFAFLNMEKALKNKTVQTVCDYFQGKIKLHEMNAIQMEDVARSLFLEPGVFPLSMLISKEHRCLYATSGYAVGTVHLLYALNELKVD